MADLRRDPRTVTAVVKRYFDYEEHEANIAEQREKGPGRRLPFYDSVRKNISSFDVGGIRKKASILRAIGFESWHGVVNGCVAAFRHRFEPDLRGNVECGCKRSNQAGGGFWNRFCTAAFPDPRSTKAVGREAEEHRCKFQNSCRAEHQRNHFGERGSAGGPVSCVGDEVPTDLRQVDEPARTMDDADAGRRNGFQKKCDEELPDSHFGCAGVGTGVDMPKKGTNDSTPRCSAGRQAVSRCNSEALADANRIDGPASSAPRAVPEDLPDADVSSLLSNRSARTASRRYSEALADPNRICGPASAQHDRGCRTRRDAEQLHSHIDSNPMAGTRKDVFEADLSGLRLNRSAGRTVLRRYSEAHADPKCTDKPAFSADFGAKRCGEFLNTSCIQETHLDSDRTSFHDQKHSGGRASCADKYGVSSRDSFNNGSCSVGSKQRSQGKYNNPGFEGLSNDDQSTIKEEEDACRNRRTELRSRFNPREIGQHQGHAAAGNLSVNSRLNTRKDAVGGPDGDFSNISVSPGTDRVLTRPVFPHQNQSGFVRAMDHQERNFTESSLTDNCWQQVPKGVQNSACTSELDQMVDANRLGNGSDTAAHCNKAKNGSCTTESRHTREFDDAPDVGADSECLGGFRNNDDRPGNPTSVDAPHAFRSGLHSAPKGQVPIGQEGNDSGRPASVCQLQADVPKDLEGIPSRDSGIAHCPRADVPRDIEDKDSGGSEIAHRPQADTRRDLEGNDSSGSRIVHHPQADMLTDLDGKDSRGSRAAHRPQKDQPRILEEKNLRGPGIARCSQADMPRDLQDKESRGSGISHHLQTDVPISLVDNDSGSPGVVSSDPAGNNSPGSGMADFRRAEAASDPKNIRSGSSGGSDHLAWPRCRNGPCEQYTSSLQTMLNKIPGLRRSQTTVTREEPKPSAPEAEDPNPDVVPDFHVCPRRAQKKGRLPDGKVAVGLGVVLLPPCPVHLAQIVRWKAESKKEEGNEAYKKKEYREALQLYTEAIELCPDYAAYYGNRSACYMMLGRYDAALADARQATRLDESFVKGHLREAKCSLALGDLAAAKFSLQKVERLEPTNVSLKEEANNIKCVEYYMVEALKSYEKQDYRQAVYHLDCALASACACSRFLLQKAECLVFLNRYQEAQEITSDLIRGDGTNADAIYVRGLCLYYQDNIEKAFTHFQQVLRYAPDHVKAREAFKRARNLKQKKEEGNTNYRSGNLQQAHDIYTEALLIDSNNVLTNAKLYFNRALVSHKLKKLNHAVEDCTLAIKLDETYVKAYIKRGRCYQELEMFEESVRDFEKVYKLDSTQENHSLLQEAKLELKKSKRKDYYKILGIGRTASDDEIKKAYRKRALVHHPDRHANAPDDIKKEQEKKFKELGEAYSILSDPKKKSRYDCGQDIETSGADYDPYNIFQTFYSEPTARHFEFSNGRFPGGGGFSGGFPGGFTFQFG